MLLDTITRVCSCGKEYSKPYSCSKRNWSEKYKSCSISCSRKKVDPSWLKQYEFKKDVQSSSKPFTKGQTLGNKNAKWKGENASYHAKHMWVRYHYGKANHCEFCGNESNRMYHWSNISGMYKRVIADWQQLCVPCHKKFDLTT